MGVICPHCKKEQEHKTEVCQNCHEKVDRRSWDRPESEAIKKICDNGHITWSNQDQNFCNNCGAALHEVKYKVNM